MRFFLYKIPATIKNMNGIFAYKKPKGITSAHFLNKLKKEFPPKTKIGHGGTLDKAAEGVLVIATGREYTKQLTEVLKDSKKEYVAEIKLGYTSDTDDSNGEITKASDIKPTKKEIENIINKFPIDKPFTQTAPLFSAKKINGKRQSDLVRQNKEVKSKESKVTLHKVKIEIYKYPIIKVKLLTSSGFYVRAFARDIGKKLKTEAYMSSLNRTKIITKNKVYS